MKKNIVYSVLSLCVILYSNLLSYAQKKEEQSDTFGNCLELLDSLNIKKNRSVQNPMAMPSLWDIMPVIKASRHNDKKDFSEDLYVYIQGYIVDFDEQGPEPCNCNKASKDLKNGNVRVYIGLKPRARKHNCVVAEITPDFKRLYPNYEKHLIKGSKVKVAGYLIYDLQYKENTTNTSTKRRRDLWRKTNWEIHPIVNIESKNVY